MAPLAAPAAAEAVRPVRDAIDSDQVSVRTAAPFRSRSVAAATGRTVVGDQPPPGPKQAPTAAQGGAPSPGIRFEQAVEVDLSPDDLGFSNDDLYVRGVAVGDLNDDGIPDLAAAVARGSSTPAGIAVLRGLGDGTFEAATFYELTGFEYWGIRGPRLADMNGDGAPDIVASNYNPPEIQVILNDGSGRFPDSALFAPVVDNPTEVTVADVDLDGNLDVVTLNYYDDTISLLRGLGTGQLQAPVDIDTVPEPVHVAVGQYDGADGLDLAVTFRSGDRVQVFEHQAGMIYAPGQSISTGWSWATQVVDGDFTGDGHLDLAVTAYWSLPWDTDDGAGPEPTCRVCLVTLEGDGAGRFSPLDGDDDGAPDREESAGVPVALDLHVSLMTAMTDVVIGDDFADYHDTWSRARRIFEQRGSVEQVHQLTLMLVEADLHRGRIESARRTLAEVADEIADHPRFRGQLELTLGRLALHEGRLGDAWRLTQEGLRHDETLRVPVLAARDRHLLGIIALAQGRPDAALDVLRPSYQVLRKGGWAEPGNFRFVADLIEAEIALGRVDEARSLVVDCWEDAKRLGRRAAVAGLLRGRALVTAADGDERSAADDAIESAKSFDDLSQPLEAARSRLVAGHLLLRCGRRETAEQLLADARHTFERFGLDRWAGDASVEPLVQVIGGFRVTEVGQQLSIRPGKPAQVVQYLACSGGRLPTDMVIDALWPDADPTTGRRGLRNALNRLRQDAPTLVVREGEMLRFAPGVEVDLADVEDAVRRGRAASRADEEERYAAADAVVRAGSSFLPDEPYADWALTAREQWRMWFVESADLLIEAALSRGDILRARSLLEQAITVEPMDERRHVLLADLAGDLDDHGSVTAIVSWLDELRAAHGLPPMGASGTAAASSRLADDDGADRVVVADRSTDASDRGL